MNNNSPQFHIRRRFSLRLKPIKIMMLDKRNLLSKEDWFRYVQMTKERILENPQEYLGTDLPDAAMLTDTVEFVFHDFLLKNYRNAKIIKMRMSEYTSGKLDQGNFQNNELSA